MKLHRTTLILMFLALSLAGAVYFFEIQGKPQREAVAAKAKQLFAFTSDQVQSFTVKNLENTLTFERISGKKTGEINWKLTTPVQAQANEAAVVFLLDKLTTGKSDRTLNVPASQRSEFGLDQPRATVEVKLNNQQTHKLLLGKSDFSGNFLYAQVDPPEPSVQTIGSQAKVPSSPGTQTISVLLVPIEFKNAVNRPLADWQNSKPN